ncbi:ABC transporter permease [Treponema denticola]|uniref:ABC transporter permease n=1 Tax=Treponema denticola TaxID=158 RepID=UPI0021070975|nr:iron ABC transporter permease [Treponema denticola]UTY22888.1 iron ABC transporter permease [Treponema denticola]
MKRQLKRNYNGLIDYILIISLILGIFIFIAMPFFYVFKESLVINGSLSFELFKDVFKNHLHLLKNSLSVGLYTTVLTAIAGISTALFSYMMPKKIKRLIFLILAVTMISPPFVTALSYINLFGRRGLVSYYLLGISKSPYGITGIVLMQSLSNFSLAALILIGFLNNLDRSQLDSARNLGAKTNRLIIDIILPVLFPAIKSVMLLTFLRSLSDFGTPAIIGGSFNVLATESYFAVIAQGNLGKASAINVLLLIPAIIIFILYQKSFKNISISSHGTASSEIEIKRQGTLFYLISIIAVFFLLWISIQYSSIIFSAFTKIKKGKMIFTFANILETRDHITSTVIRSIAYSLIAAVGGSIIGLLIAYYKQIRKIKIMQAVDFAATLPYIIPGTFFGLGYLLAFNSKPLMLTGTAAIVVLNILFKQLPFSTKIGNAAMEEINIDTLNSIRDLGGKRINEITDAVIPLSKNALVVSFINGFTTTMTTIGSIIFLVYPSQKILTLVMFDVIQSGYYEIGSVIALLIIIICLIVNLIYFLVLKKK